MTLDDIRAGLGADDLPAFESAQCESDVPTYDIDLFESLESDEDLTPVQLQSLQSIIGELSIVCEQNGAILSPCGSGFTLKMPGHDMAIRISDASAIYSLAVMHQLSVERIYRVFQELAANFA